MKVYNNQIKRLWENLKILNEAQCLDNEFEVFAEESPECNDISELNDIIESEISYWAEDAEVTNE